MYVAQKWLRFWGNDMHKNKDLKRVVSIRSNATRFRLGSEAPGTACPAATSGRFERRHVDNEAIAHVGAFHPFERGIDVLYGDRLAIRQAQDRAPPEKCPPQEQSCKPFPASDAPQSLRIR